MSHKDTSNLSDVLAFRDNVGSVSRCLAGCIQIAISQVGMRFTKREFWALMEMLSEAAQLVVRKGSTRFMK
jgi:hypothetical protein